MASFVSHTSPVGFGHVLLSPVRALVTVIEWIREANRMASEYTQLSHKTDAQLTKAGISREELPRAIVCRANVFWKFP